MTFMVAVAIVLPRFQAPPAPIAVQSQRPTIQSLERLSPWVATRAVVADVLVGVGEGCRGAWLIRSDALNGFLFPVLLMRPRKRWGHFHRESGSFSNRTQQEGEWESCTFPSLQR
jgi:hypothetical protein